MHKIDADLSEKNSYFSCRNHGSCGRSLASLAALPAAVWIVVGHIKIFMFSCYSGFSLDHSKVGRSFISILERQGAGQFFQYDCTIFAGRGAFSPLDLFDKSIRK